MSHRQRADGATDSVGNLVDASEEGMPFFIKLTTSAHDLAEVHVFFAVDELPDGNRRSPALRAPQQRRHDGTVETLDAEFEADTAVS